MTFGAFAVAVALGKRGEDNLSIRKPGWARLEVSAPGRGDDRLHAVARRHSRRPRVSWPSSTYSAPPWGEGFVGLVLIGVVNTLVSVYYYLRVVMVLYFGSPSPDPELPPLPLGLRLPLLVAAAADLILGLYPAPFLELARRAALEFF